MQRGFVRCNDLLASSRCVDGVGNKECDAAERNSTNSRDNNGYGDPEKPRHGHRLIRVHHRSKRKNADAAITPILNAGAGLRAAAVEPPHAGDNPEDSDLEFENYPIVLGDNRVRFPRNEMKQPVADWLPCNESTRKREHRSQWRRELASVCNR
jgi:hypothetical protein